MRKLIFAATAAATLVAAPAFAQSVSAPAWYGNLGYSNIQPEDSDADLGAVTGRIGARLHPNFGVEGEGAFGLNESSEAGIDYKLKHEAAAYAVGFLPVAPNVDLIGRVGYGTQKIEASAGGLSASASEESWNYGVGAQWFPSGGLNGVRGDYTRHEFQHGDDSANVWSLSYVRRF